MKELFESLEQINSKPKPFSAYTTETLWNDTYISKRMLKLHLDPEADLATRKKAFIDQSIAWMIKHFQICKNVKICDFGCGPGLYTSPLAKKGAQVMGIDFSERSIKYAREYAKEHHLPIEYIHQNYLDFTTDKRFDLITMIYCDYCTLGPMQRKRLLNNFYNFLTPNGSILVDVFSKNQYNFTQEQATYERSSNLDFWSNFWSENPYFVFKNTFKYEEEDLLLDKYTIIEKNRTREIFNWLQCYDLISLRKEFSENGFDIVEKYSNVCGDPFHADSMEIAIVAKKK